MGRGKRLLGGVLNGVLEGYQSVVPYISSAMRGREWMCY